MIFNLKFVKYLFLKILFFFTISFYPLIAFSQNIEAIGKAYRLNGNVQFSNEKFNIPAKAKIISIKGDKTSFSIYGANNNIYNFFYSNGNYEPSPFDTLIKHGFYIILPDLPDKKDSVTIKIEFELVGENP